MDDPDPIGPASEDDEVQAFLDVRWREAMRATRDAMASLRDVVPELKAHLPETAYVHIKRALGEAESAYGSLHQAGKFVVGEEEYARYLEAQVKRGIGG